MPTEALNDDVKHLVNVVLAALKVEGNAYSLGADGKARVAKALAAYKHPTTRQLALKELVCLAWFFEKKQQSPHAAREILDVAQLAAGDLASLREALTVDSDTLHTAAKRYQQLLGESAGPAAPQLGEQGAEGSMKAGNTLIGKLRRV